MSEQVRQTQAEVLSWIDKDITGPMRDFQNPNQEWRRLFSELYGTFLLVIVAAFTATVPIDRSASIRAGLAASLLRTSAESQSR